MRVKDVVFETFRFQQDSANGKDTVDLNFQSDAKKFAASGSFKAVFYAVGDGAPFSTFSVDTILSIKSKFTYLSGAHDVTRDQGGANTKMRSGDMFGGALAARDNIVVVGHAVRELHMTTATAGGANGKFFYSGGSWGGVSIFSASEGKALSATNPAGFIVTGTIRPTLDVSPGLRPGGRFGCAVDISKDFTVAVGAEAEDITVDSSLHSDRGAVYIYNSSSLGWVFKQKVQHSDGHASSGHLFGATVAIDGEHLLVGAPKRPGSRLSGNTETGAVFAFRRTGTTGSATWTQIQIIDQPDGASNHNRANYDHFGQAIAIDGTTAIIGQPSAQTGGTQNAGMAFIYNYSGGQWNFTQALTSSDLAEKIALGGHHPRTGRLYDAQFGHSVAIEGGKCIVGAPGMISYTLSSSRGPYILYGTNLSSSHGIANKQNGTWYPLFHLEEDAVRYDKSIIGGSNPGNKPLRFQYDVNPGRTFFLPSGSWVKLGASSSAGLSPANHTTSSALDGGPGNFDYYNSRVSYNFTNINNTGSLSFTTYPNAKGSTSLYNGAAYVFEKNASGLWTQVKKLQENDPNGVHNGHFGSSVSILNNFLVVGAADQHRSGARDGAGFAYVYKSASVSGWSFHQRLTSSLAMNHVYRSGTPSPVFGFSTAITPNFIFVGDPNGSTASFGPNNKHPGKAPGVMAGHVGAYYLNVTSSFFKDRSRAAGTRATGGYNVITLDNGVSNGNINLSASLSSIVGADTDGLWLDATLISAKKFDG